MKYQVSASEYYNIIANITGILYTSKPILRAIIENPRDETSFEPHSV